MVIIWKQKKELADGVYLSLSVEADCEEPNPEEKINAYFETEETKQEKKARLEKIIKEAYELLSKDIIDFITE